MKIHIEKKNSPALNTIEIPSSVNLKHLSLGEKFYVNLIPLDGSEKISQEACLVADGRSILIGENVVRLSNLRNANDLKYKIVRPVEPKQSSVKKGFGILKSPMTGKVISVPVKNEDVVKKDDVLVIIEAMKMENRILAEVDGLVKNIKVTNGMNITSGEALLTLVESGKV